MHRKDTPEFFVGDTVQVVSEPYRNCPFTWVDDMDKYCGVIATITKKSYVEARKEFQYQIDVDHNGWKWCGNCFMPVVETPDFDISDDEFNEILLIARG